MHELEMRDQSAGIRFLLSAGDQDGRLSLRHLTLACTGCPFLSFGNLGYRGLPKLLEHPCTKSLTVRSSTLAVPSSVPGGSPVLCIDLGRISAAYTQDTGRVDVLFESRGQGGSCEVFFRSSAEGTRQILSGGIRHGYHNDAGDLEMIHAFTQQMHELPAFLHQLSLRYHLPQMDCESVCRYSSEDLYESSSRLTPIQTNESFSITALGGRERSLEVRVHRSTCHDGRISLEMKKLLKAPGLGLSWMYAYRTEDALRAVQRTVREYSVKADAGLLRFESSRVERIHAGCDEVSQSAVLSALVHGWELSWEISREDGDTSCRMSLVYACDGQKFLVADDSFGVTMPL